MFGPLDDADKRLIDTIVRLPRRVASRQDIISEGDAPSDVHLVVDGLCCRYKILKGGNRQIFAYLVPGDFCDLHIFILKTMNHSIATLTPSLVVDIPRARVLELSDRPKIARALWWATLVDEATLREWVVNLGHRDAERRIAHLFCELHLRMQSVGLTHDGTFELSITQAELADTLGMSAVHLNRSLQALRSLSLIQFSGKQAQILDLHRLKNFAGFNSNYLHLEGGKPEPRNATEPPDGNG